MEPFNKRKLTDNSTGTLENKKNRRNNKRRNADGRNKDAFAIWGVIIVRVIRQKFMTQHGRPSTFSEFNFDDFTMFWVLDAEYPADSHAQIWEQFTFVNKSKACNCHAFTKF